MLMNTLLSTVIVKKKTWKVPNIKTVKIPRHRCEKVISMIDQGLSLYKIAKITGYPQKEILAISRHRYDLRDDGYDFDYNQQIQ